MDFRKELAKEELYSLFKTYSEESRKETGVLYDVRGLKKTKGDKKLIELGKSIVDILILDIKFEAGIWFFALSEILQVDPIKYEHRSSLQRMREDWIQYYDNPKDYELISNFPMVALNYENKQKVFIQKEYAPRVVKKIIKKTVKVDTKPITKLNNFENLSFDF